MAPLTVAFSNDSEGNYTHSEWAFGDGITSTLQSPTHTYATARAYTVTLTVSGTDDSDTLAEPACVTVYTRVRAAFTVTPSAGPAPLVVDFTNMSTGDYDKSLWDFGDATTSDWLGNPTHAYSAPGTYTVTLAVEGPGGTDTVTGMVHALGSRRVYLPFVQVDGD